METVLVIALILLNIIQYGFNYFERKDMLDRLMAKSLPEYKDNVVQEENHIEPTDDGTVDVESAKELIYGDEE